MSSIANLYSIRAADFCYVTYVRRLEPTTTSIFCAPTRMKGKHQRIPNLELTSSYYREIMAWPLCRFFQPGPKEHEKIDIGQIYAISIQTIKRYAERFLQWEDNRLKPTHEDGPRNCPPDCPRNPQSIISAEGPGLVTVKKNTTNCGIADPWGESESGAQCSSLYYVRSVKRCLDCERICPYGNYGSWEKRNPINDTLGEN